MKHTTIVVSVVVLVLATSVLIMSFPSGETIGNRPHTFANKVRLERLTVEPPGVLTVTPANGLTSTGPAGGPFNPSSIVYTLQNTGGEQISWTAKKTQTWLARSPGNGTLAPGASATVTVSIKIDANSLLAGTYNDTVTFTNATNGQGNTTRPVSLKVVNPGKLSVTPSNGLTAKGLPNQLFNPSSIVYTLQNTGGAPINWTATNTQTSWLACSPGNGTLAPGASATVGVVIGITPDMLGSGTLVDTVTFTNTTNGLGNTTRSVSATVLQLPPGVLTVTPANGLASTGPAGGPFNPTSIVYTLYNGGGTQINWTATKTQTWLARSPGDGTLYPMTSATVTVSIKIDANSLSAGTYNDTVTFTNTTNGTGNTTRPVSLTVSPAQPDAEEQAMINLINTYRQQGDNRDNIGGVPVIPLPPVAPLTYSAPCQAAAEWMANDLATRNPSVGLSHVDSLGRDVGTRAQAFRFTFCSELEGMGALAANQMLAMWQDSDMHRKLLLSPTCKTVGSARTTGPNGVFWIVNMGQ